MGIAKFDGNVDIPEHVPEHLVLPFSPWAELGDQPHNALQRAQRFGDIVYSPQHHITGFAPNGSWMVTRAKEAREILLNTEFFSSNFTTGIPQALGETWHLAPIEVDPPDHAAFRQFLNPDFMPSAVRNLEPKVRKHTTELIDGFASKGECEFVRDFAKILPSQVFLDLMGLPQDRLPEFLEWEELIMDSITIEDRLKGLQSVANYLRDEIEQRVANPRDDLLSKVANHNLHDDQKGYALGMAILLYIAGLDTVVNSLGWQFRHLAENPDDQRVLEKNRDAITPAIEEMFRRFSIVSLTRRVTNDVDVAGVQMKAGDIVAIPSPLISRDDAAFEGGENVDISAGNRRHMAFGTGPHTCLGLHLARLIIRCAIDEWLNVIPSFKVADGEDVQCTGGAVLTMVSMPLTWTVEKDSVSSQA